MIAVRPPEYFPGISYCALMASCRRFIVADTFPFSRQSFHNRALLRTPNGRQWITIPLEGGGRGRVICDAKVDARKVWAPRHRRSLEYNYRSSPYFEYYEEQVMAVLMRPAETLGQMTVDTVRLLHALLHLDSTLIIASEDGAGRPPDPSTLIEAAGEEGRIATLPDAADHDLELWPELTVVDVEPVPYRQVFEGFEAGLSALDLLFNLGPDAASWLRSHCRIEPRSHTHRSPGFGPIGAGRQ